MKAYGATCVGKSHIKRELPNQDSFIVCNGVDYTLGVVCDGVGSAKFPKYGSNTLCKTIEYIIKKDYANKLDSLSDSKTFNSFINDVKNKWRKNISPFCYSDCSTTCLIVIITKKNIYTAQVGDGYILVSDAEQIVAFHDSENEYANVTYSINSSIDRWKLNVLQKTSESYKVLMCTDGISDSIKIDNAFNFIEFLSSNINNKKEKKNNKYLFDLLKNWPNEYATDDKTIVVVK